MSKKHHTTSVHHRKCRSNGGDSSARNISVVNKYAHQSWHNLFQNFEAEKICEIINRVWLDPDYELVVRRKR